MSDGPDIACVGLEPAVGRLVTDAAQNALAALDMAADLQRLEIVADDLGGCDEGWLRLGRGGPGEAPSLALYCHADAFSPARQATSTVFPPRAVWEQREGPAVEAGLTAAGFSRARTDAFVHHHLLWARDLLRGELKASQIPGSLAEAFAAAWAVTVDGRLARLGLPGYPLVERRGRFSRLFSTAGVLMPGHWNSFQALWDGLASRPRDVVALVRRLPRL